MVEDKRSKEKVENRLNQATIKFTGYPAGDRHCIRKYNVYLQLEIEIDIVSKNWTLSISIFLKIV